MSDIDRKHTNARSSRMVIYNGIVHMAGRTAPDRSAGIEGQTRQVLAKIDESLVEIGVDKSRLLTAQIFLRDIDRDFDGMNSVWNVWTAPGAAPTRATFEAKMAAPDILVEIILTAAAAA